MTTNLLPQGDADWSDLLKIQHRIRSAKVVGVEMLPQTYINTTGRRGSPDYVMSRSELLQVVACPHRWVAGWKKKETDAMEYGSLLDTLILTPGQFESRYAVCPETYPDTKTGKPKPWNRNATFCDEWEAKQGDKTCIKVKELEEAQAAVKVFSDHPILSGYLAGSQRQVMCIGEYEAANGLMIPVKCLIDIVPVGDYSDGLGDLKTATDASPKKWATTVWNYGYHVQAALELDIYNTATNEIRNEFRHVIQESEFPYEPGIRLMSAEFVAKGREHYMKALDFYAECVAKNEWPGYDREDQGFRMFNGWTLIEPEMWMLMKS